MNILNLVASDTLSGFESVVLPPVATGTRSIRMPSLQRKICVFMIERVALPPTLTTVTTLTVITQSLAVRVIFLMTAAALSWRFMQRVIGGMAVIAGHISMSTHKRKIGIFVIESIRIQGNTIKVPALMFLVARLTTTIYSGG